MLSYDLKEIYITSQEEDLLHEVLDKLNDVELTETGLSSTMEQFRELISEMMNTSTIVVPSDDARFE